jgi:hypothetical protein
LLNGHASGSVAGILFFVFFAGFPSPGLGLMIQGIVGPAHGPSPPCYRLRKRTLSVMREQNHGASRVGDVMVAWIDLTSLPDSAKS